jgi:hypothetical protein
MPPSEITATADRRRHRLLDQIGLTGAGGEAGLLDRPLLDPCDTGGNADNHARVGEAVGVDLFDEVAQHLLGDVEVGDHAVLERPYRRDVARRATQHPLRFDPHRVHLAGLGIDRDHRGLGEHNSSSAYVDERVGRAEVDGHVAAAEPSQISEYAHS